MLDARYPFAEGSLEPAFTAADGVCGGADAIVDAVRRIVVASAPHVGAAALLDFADELCPVGTDLPVDRAERLSHEMAAQLRARAHRLADWDRSDELSSGAGITLRIAAS